MSELSILLNILLAIALAILVVDTNSLDARLRELEAKGKPNEWDAPVGWGPEEMDD